MKVIAKDSFFKSIKKLIDSRNPFKLIFWRYKWLDFKGAIWALWKYFRITTKMVPWDYSSILEMMKFQITILADYLEHKGIEVDKDRLPKIKKMRRFIELADHHLKDDYFERCNFNYDNSEFEKIDEGYELVHKDEKINEENRIALKSGYDLEKEEWNEMIKILKDMRSWWD
jgi:hypothetical protein